MRRFPLHREETSFPPSAEGSFGAIRTHDIHTGVDLYTRDGAEVFAVEAGTVVAIERFTGAPESPWWLPTLVILVAGPSGVIAYGEVTAAVVVGSFVLPGQFIARVAPVLPTWKQRADIPNHSRCMLHFELYRPGTKTTSVWRLNEPQPSELLDPTRLLTETWNP